MAARVEFLQQLFSTGKVMMRAPPAAEPGDRRAALEMLEETHYIHGLEVAGPALEFRPELALAAAEFVRAACWYLVQHDDPAEVLERRLALPAPQTAADHLMGDLLMRYVPNLHRRARAIAPNDPLCTILARVLRTWPLSGVLSDVMEVPLTEVDFDGHHGLMLQYAERLFRHQKTEWLPHGRALEYVELVFRDHGQERAPFLRSRRAANEVEKATT
jgi:hypothetical protein